MSRCPEHGASLVDTGVYNGKVVALGEHVLVGQVHAAFVGGGADFVAVGDEAAVLVDNVRLLTCIKVI